MKIRDARPQDLAGIQAIMNYYRLHTTHIWDRNPVPDGEMARWFKNHSVPPYAALVAVEDRHVAGYASLSRFRPYAGYAPVAENSIYLIPDRMGQGIGRPLMEALLRRAQENGLRVVTAWIDSENGASVRFHEKFGFCHAGVLKKVGILDGEPRSVIIMQCEVY